MGDTARLDGFFAKVAQAPVVMGIVNITPDSFSDGGHHFAPQMAIDHALRLEDEGAEIVDIGGESTRPGAREVAAPEEWRRLEVALPEIVRRVAIPVSVDTSKASVAALALEAGALMINDIYGFRRDEAMAAVVGRAEAGAILMHHGGGADVSGAQGDVFSQINAGFEASLTIARAGGVNRSHILLDPRIGFGKTMEQNLMVLANLDRFLPFACPLLVGASRKRVIDFVVHKPVSERLCGTLAAHLRAVQKGARVVRVHDVEAHKDALNMLRAIDDAC